jgi:hypothetical protein
MIEYHSGSIILSRVVFPRAPFLSLFPFILIMVIDVSCVAKCNETIISLVSFSPPSLLLLSSFSPLALFGLSFTLVSPHHQHIFHLDSDEVELLIRSE